MLLRDPLDAYCACGAVDCQHLTCFDPLRRIRDAYEALRDKEHRLALRLFGPPPLTDLTELLDAFPTERRYVGPGPWLNVLREHRR